MPRDPDDIQTHRGPRFGKKVHVSLLMAIVLLLFGGAAGAEDDSDYDRILDRYRKAMKRPGLERKAAAIRLLDPNRAESLPELTKVLTHEHWFLRGRAAEALSQVTDESLRAELRLELLTGEEWMIREGIALAFALTPVKGDAEALADGMSDEAWEVRRAAAIALEEIISKESMLALILALRREKDARVSVHIADTLRRVTGRDFGRDGEKWIAWWEKHKDEIFKGVDEEVKARDLGGIKLETVTVATRRRPEGGEEDHLDIFVLAPLGWSHRIYRPWLNELTRFGRVTYVNLPRIQDLTGSSGYGPKAPTYPVERLVKALEKLREELGRNRVVLFAEGATGWIATRYAVRHTKRTAGLIVLNGYLDKASYALALGRLARSPMPGERWAALTLMGQTPDEHDEPCHRRVGLTMLTGRLPTPSDLLGHLFWERARDPQGFVTVPEMKLKERAKIEIPSLFYFGGKSRMSGYGDAARIRKHFPNNVIAVMLESRGYPYVTEYDKFYEVMERFFEYHGLR
ncbi:MAG: hypothetical protein ABFS86_05815 [Planctomycetota bacterium]